MNRFFGSKTVSATAMNRADYNTYRGWQLPANENGADEGYLVEYQDGGAPNDSRHKGYISWSPKAQFDAAYRPVTALTFGQAIEALKAGHCVARGGWNGKGMFLYLIKGVELQQGLKYGYGEYVNEPAFVSSICMKTADNKLVVGWLASQTDMLAEDWEILA